MWRLYCNLLLLPTEVTHGTPTRSTSWLPVANRTVPISDDPSMCSVTCMRLNCLSIFKGHFSRGPGLVGTRMSPFWILLELRVVEVMVTTGAMRSAKLWTVKSSPPTNQHPTFYRPDILPVTQPTVSKHKRKGLVY